jgi:Mg-chelatase subunit ChlI
VAGCEARRANGATKSRRVPVPVVDLPLGATEDWVVGALAALESDAEVGAAHLRPVTSSALRRRLRRNPLDEADATVRVERAVTELLGP